MSKLRGFTLIEVMVVVAILGILASIALPSYQDYLRRGRIAEGLSALSETKVKMEQWFQDNRTYASGGIGTYPCGAGLPNIKSFTLSCPTADANNLTITATGKADANLDGFNYSIDQAGVRSSTTPWGNSASCWVDKKGAC
ncbi:MAG: pilus assembly protein PilE [Betaproteobacteria bacterium HGW-Betaproteobacteria-14]|nr:MAG: pilus assembly protein PilE [Betaproteobacteria bacterium HGW-Betaproteobacteria-14]